MININILINLNRVIIVITGALYFTIIYGLMAQFVLGVFQVLMGVGLLLFWKRLTKKHQKLLGYYWLSITLYVGSWYFGFFDSLDNPWLSMAIIPLGIAAYFTYFLETLRVKRKDVLSLN